MGRRSLAALVALMVWVVGLFALTEIRPEWVLPVVGGSVAAVGLVVARIHVRQQRGISHLAGLVRKESKRLRTDVDGALSRMQADLLALRDLQHGSALKIAKTRRATEELEASVRRLVAALADGGPGTAPSVVYRQVEALLGLYAVLEPRRELPPLGGWPASPEMLLLLYGEIRARRPSLVVECGSGVSTVVMAYALEHAGTGSLVALEHDPTYAAATERLLSDHGLEADVRRAPLRSIDVAGSPYEWYDPSALPDGPISLLFVDGPPGNVGPRARYPAFPVLVDRLGPDAAVVVDDYDRGDEREAVAAWLTEHPEWEARRVEVDRGGVILERKGAGER